MAVTLTTPDTRPALPAATGPVAASPDAALPLLRDFDERVERLAQSIARAAEAACRGDGAGAACQVAVPATPLPLPPQAATPPELTAAPAHPATRDIAEVAAAIACMGRQWPAGAPAGARSLVRMECEVVGGPWAGTRFVQQPGAGPDASLLVSLPQQAWRLFERRRAELTASLPAWLRRHVEFRRQADPAVDPSGMA